MRIGVFGGTFDPVHLGHLLIAEKARVNLQLQEVIFVPAGIPWMKTEQSITSSEHRVNMVNIAIMSNPFFRVSCFEVEKAGASYTVETLEEMAKIHEGAKLFLIVGSDIIEEFDKWKAPDKVLQFAHLVIFNRRMIRNRGSDDYDIPSKVKGTDITKITWVPGPELKISSSNIRRRVSEGKSIRDMVSDEVIKYIADHGLYLDGE